jgi:hypothetical protein
VHLGLIGGIGPAATEFYYRGLVARYAGAAKPMELTIVHADVRELSENAAAGDAQKQAQIFARLVRRLASAGAEAAAITSIGGHFCVTELVALSLSCVRRTRVRIPGRRLRGDSHGCAASGVGGRSEQPTKLDFSVNLKTATALGLTVPPLLFAPMK